MAVTAKSARGAARKPGGASHRHAQSSWAPYQKPQGARRQRTAHAAPHSRSNLLLDELTYEGQLSVAIRLGSIL